MAFLFFRPNYEGLGRLLSAIGHKKIIEIQEDMIYIIFYYLFTK